MNNTLLQCYNVWWNCGVTKTVLEIAKALPFFHHVVTFRHNNNVNEELVQEAQRLKIELFHLSVLTEEFINKHNPMCTIVHSPQEGFLNNWIKNYPAFTYHHALRMCKIRLDKEVFCSQYLATQFGLPDGTVIPPCSDIKLSPKRLGPLTFGTVLSPWDKDKMDMMAVNQVRNFCNERGYKYIVLGQDIKFNNDIQSFYNQIDVLVHILSNDKHETWGKIVNEAMSAGCYVIASNREGIPEQFVPSVDQITPADLGILVRDRYGLLNALDNVCINNGTWVRNNRINRHKHAVSIGGKDTLVQKILPVILENS